MTAILLQEKKVLHTGNLITLQATSDTKCVKSKCSSAGSSAVLIPNKHPACLFRSKPCFTPHLSYSSGARMQMELKLPVRSGCCFQEPEALGPASEKVELEVLPQVLLLWGDLVLILKDNWAEQYFLSPFTPWHTPENIPLIFQKTCGTLAGIASPIKTLPV